MHLRYELRLNPARDGCRGSELGMTNASSRLSSFCLWDGYLQLRAVFARYATIYVAVQNMGGEFLHPIGRMSGIATSSSPLPPKSKTNPILGTSVGGRPMR